MKKMYCMIAFLMLSAINYLYAQSNNDIGKISLSVVMPENVEGLNSSHLSKLENKIAQIVLSSGMAANGYSQSFVVYPKFQISTVDVVEGGMQNVTVVNTELNLFIKQVETNLLFASVNKSLKGSGRNEDGAIADAISKIGVNDPVFKSFIETGKSKIVNYFETACNDIMLQSEGLARKQNYEQALGLLMSIPEVSSCFAEAQEKSFSVFKTYQSQTCEQTIQKAKAKLAGKFYDETLNILSEIDPSASCFQDAIAMSNTVARHLSEEEQRQRDFKMKQYNDAVSLEQKRINAIKSIAVSYYSNRPKTVSYIYIAR